MKRISLGFVLILAGLLLSGCTLFSPLSDGLPRPGQLVVRPVISSLLEELLDELDSNVEVHMNVTLTKDHRERQQTVVLQVGDGDVGVVFEDLIRGTWQGVVEIKDETGSFEFAGVFQATVSNGGLADVEVELDLVQVRFPETLRSLNAPYTISNAMTHTSHTDAGGDKLTDGILGSEAWWEPPSTWVGLSLTAGKAYYEIVIDLGDTYSLTRARVQSLNASDSGIALPGEIRVAVSEDEATWSEMSSTAPVGGWGTFTQWDEVSLNEIPGRYVKIEVVPTGEWTFLGEIEVYGRRLP